MLMFKLRFWSFQSMFLEMQFSLAAAIFSLVWVICFSWYLHHKLSHEFLIFTSFNIWRLEYKSISFYIYIWLAFICKLVFILSIYIYIWIILKCYYTVDLILDSLWVILVSYCKICAFSVIIFYIAYFQNF